MQSLTKRMIQSTVACLVVGYILLYMIMKPDDFSSSGERTRMLLLRAQNKERLLTGEQRKTLLSSELKMKNIDDELNKFLPRRYDVTGEKSDSSNSDRDHKNKDEEDNNDDIWANENRIFTVKSKEHKGRSNHEKEKLFDTKIDDEAEDDEKEEGENISGKDRSVIRETITPPTSPWVVQKAELDSYSKPVTQNGLKFIALYYLPGRERGAYTGSHRFRKCQYNKCSFTHKYSKADALIFDARDLLFKPLKKMWYRPQKQRWIFKTVDPVVTDFGLDNDTVRSLFNWTTSYKIDSDIPLFLGRLQRKVEVPPKNYAQIFRQKKKLVAWFVSHCETWSKREEYVERMQKIAPVDIFGRCGPYKCGTRHGRMIHDLPKCFPILTSTYKFYLSFENSFCEDYVSEKFFKMFVHDVQVIPVVRGGVNYGKAFPPGTFIDAADFKSPEALMAYLVELGNDEKAYTRMLRLKDEWEYSFSNPELSTWCSICRKLHTDDEEKYYKDIHKTLAGNPNECWAPRDLGPKYLNKDFADIMAESTSARIRKIG